METEIKELKELIAHKLYFVEQKPVYAAIAALQPLQFCNLPHVALLGGYAVQTLVKETELVIFQFTGKTIPEILSSLPELMALSGLAETVAALNGKLVLVDDQVFAAANEVQQLEILAEVFYPKLFAFGHEGSAWTKLNF